ncbi:MAG: hypothetical protein HY287_02335 [Planctomycetes bacterium]|nr:hypothetical protein [Planctomycetota bacterium]MBI3833147.1 hypothetical protein [Planctomycetota bacterium]
MNSLFESDIVRNTSLGAVVLWRFTRSWFDQGEAKIPTPLEALMLVLPMSFHDATVTAIADRNRDGALLKALAEDRTILLGLQHRMQAFAGRTFRSMNLSLSGGLLKLDRLNGIRVLPSRATEPIRYSTEEPRRILRTADRLGHSMALTGFETTCSLLNVRF